MHKPSRVSYNHDIKAITDFLTWVSQTVSFHCFSDDNNVMNFEIKLEL